MTKDDKDKRARILEAAAKLFATQPFHKVLLSDVAAAASVGKGTLYLYFRSKEDLFMGILLRGFSQLLERMHSTLADSGASPEQQLTDVVREMVLHLQRKSHMTELLRGAYIGYPTDGEWADKRAELRGLIESVIRRGVEQGVFQDDHPELTAQYIPGMLRAVSLHRPAMDDAETVSRHAADFILQGLRRQD